LSAYFLDSNEEERVQVTRKAREVLIAALLKCKSGKNGTVYLAGHGISDKPVFHLIFQQWKMVVNNI